MKTIDSRTFTTIKDLEQHLNERRGTLEGDGYRIMIQPNYISAFWNKVKGEARRYEILGKTGELLGHLTVFTPEIKESQVFGYLEEIQMN